MSKRCITPSYDSLFAHKLEFHITDVFVHSLHKKFSFQSKGSYFANSASFDNGIYFNFLKIPTYRHFSLYYVYMHVVNGDGSFRQIHFKFTVPILASTPAGKTTSCYY